MRYLTKKWGDGSDYACLLKISIKMNPNLAPLKLLTVDHQIKAEKVKCYLTAKYKIDFGDNN